jgi:hypothetical protein
MRYLPLLLLSACSGELSVSETQQLAKCPPYGCGTNSPEVMGRLFFEVNEVGVANEQGLRLVGFGKEIGGVWIDLRADVQNAQLFGLDPSTGMPVIDGSQLVGSMFTIQDDTNDDTYFVTVTAAAEMPMWTSAPYQAQTWNYELEYTSTSTPQITENLCNAAGSPTYDEMNPFRAVLFDDDRIDTDGKRVDSETANWFTIGCAGSALAKLHLTSHTKAGSLLVGRTTTIDQRTSFLKMLVADYCGTGDAFTAVGVDLHYRDQPGIMNTALPTEAVEALWGPQGAICVNEPRLHYSWVPSDFGAVIDDELADSHCTLPPACTPTTYSTRYPFRTAYALSTNY